MLEVTASTEGDEAPPQARRDDREYREYLRKEQRSPRGCIVVRMPALFSPRAARPDSTSTALAANVQMRWSSASVACTLAALLSACRNTPAAPSGISAENALLGYAVNAIDAAPAAGLLVRVGTARPVTTDSRGYFEAEIAAPGKYEATLSDGASTIVDRHTTVNAPAAERYRFSLIPVSFDLEAFDEMFRTTNARLQRWTTRPALVVLASVMSLKDGSGGSYPATSEQMSDEEVSEMIAHLTEGLSLLTGRTYTTFARVEAERPADGERVTVRRPGTIVVGRYTGVVSTAGTIGIGQWAEEADGSISGGATFLDHDFDRTDSRRRLLRIHELGHALGYLHVTRRSSIMNPAIGPEPTAFDRAGAIIAFQRSPGNRAPDIDPSSAPMFSTGPKGAVRWAAPVY